MTKIEELTCLDSCGNKAKNDEMIFVLLGRDKAAPIAIRAWIEERIRIGENKRTDLQILDAEKCAKQMENS